MWQPYRMRIPSHRKYPGAVRFSPSLDTSAIDPEMLESCTVNGKLVRIPLAITMCGMVVNKTSLEKEGLEIPQTYTEFLRHL